jgi:biopolymer transport protein ExbB
MRTVVRALAIACSSALAPFVVHAADSAPQRTRITLNTSAQGLETKDASTAVSVAVRLHSGNFDFLSAKEDGSDLRVFAGDDKTPLKFSIERFDSLNELAVLWVQVPSVAPGTDKNMIYVHAGDAKPAGEGAGAGAAGFDAATLAAIHFSDKEALGIDAIAGLKTAAPIAVETNGLLAGSAKLTGTAVAWLASDKLKVDAGGAVTVSLWIKPDATAGGTLLRWGPLTLSLQGGKLAARVGQVALAGGDIAPQAWAQAALTVGGGKAVLYANGSEVAHADAALPAVAGPLEMGDGVKGLADELEIAATARSADWMRVSAGAQGAESKLVASAKDAGESAADGASPGYMSVLVRNLTTDAWAVIIILAVMFAVACWVMVTKTMFVLRADKDNRHFLKRFRGASMDLLHLGQAGAHPHSSLFRLYEAGVRELNKREFGHADRPAPRPLSGASLDAVKASVDADLVRESHRLNAQMVFLTIAISGGPFLGLLGTVVGVMVTFAAIAAAGDVNVNAIAPGIASALLATVAGLAVAIPSLFGYNYLASRIKNISSDMQIFVDEFVTRVAETYGAP